MHQGDWDGDNTESSYYRFYTVWDAERTALDLVDFYELLPVEDTQLDGAWWQNFEEYGYQRLVVWEERQVMEVTYDGSSDITEHLALYEEVLQTQ